MREFRQNASLYLRRVRAGERFEITDRGDPIVELGPRTESAYERLVREGVIIPARKPFDLDGWPLAQVAPGQPTASEILQEMRDEERS